MRQPGVLPESTAWSNHVHADHITYNQLYFAILNREGKELTKG